MKEKKESQADLQKLNWLNIAFLLTSPVVAIVGLVWWIAAGHFSWLTVALTLVFGLLTGVGITAGYHRLFSHRSFEAPWPVRLALILLGGAGFEGSVWEWCVDHRKHHNHVDGEKDPYSIVRGFWHAHILWLFYKGPPPKPESGCRDLWRDPLVRFQHSFYVPLAIIVSLLLPAAIASLWGDFFGGLLVAGAFRFFVNQHFTFAINSVCHCFGRQTYSTNHSARDNWLTAFFTYGEGYHNFHHEFPGDYRNGVRFYHWDPTKWVILALDWLGLARNLVRVQPETILVKRMAVREARLRERLPTEPNALSEFATNLLESTRARVNEAAERLKTIRAQYHRMTREERKVILGKFKALRRQLRQAEREFRQTVALWESMARRLQKMLVAESRMANAMA